MSVVAGIAVLLAFLHQYFDLTITDSDHLRGIYGAIADGRADAPDWFRILAPALSDRLAEASGNGSPSGCPTPPTARRLLADGAAAQA